MSDSWYKVDNVAKVFLATASQRDPRVFRISCTLNEEIDPDTLNEALRSTAILQRLYREFAKDGLDVTLYATEVER